MLENLACRGDEEMLINCSHSGFGVHRCSHYQDAGVVCLGGKFSVILTDADNSWFISYMYISTTVTDDCTEGQVRLVTGSNRKEGAVQICVHGYWGTICGSSASWNSRAADVVCNQLGYSTYGWN